MAFDYRTVKAHAGYDYLIHGTIVLFTVRALRKALMGEARGRPDRGEGCGIIVNKIEIELTPWKLSEQEKVPGLLKIVRDENHFGIFIEYACGFACIMRIFHLITPSLYRHVIFLICPFSWIS